jgi:hypothetical protein
MAIEPEHLGAGGAGGGIIAALFYYFGFSSRIKALEDDVQRVKDGVVWGDSCKRSHDAINNDFASMDRKLDLIIAKLK